MKSLKQFSGEISEWRSKKGFYTPCFISGDVGTILSNGDAMLGKLFLVCSELAEAGEAVRDGDFEHFKEEIADTFIRLFDICGTTGIDIEKEVEKKMKVNESRPIKHGRKTTL